MLLDVFGADPKFGASSRDAVRQCLAVGNLIACEVVWAEVASVFPGGSQARTAMERLGVDFSPLDVVSALTAGETFNEYRRRGGKRDRMIADFLIGAHARERAERLLTRDRGFYRSYFDELPILVPSG